jgi:hypothetical protein
MYGGKPKCARSPVDFVRAVPTVFEGRDHDDKKIYGCVPHYRLRSRSNHLCCNSYFEIYSF